jgi:hypothetical protein
MCVHAGLVSAIEAEERETFFLALAPAVLDRLLELVSDRDLGRELRARLMTESVVVRQRLVQACCHASGQPTDGLSARNDEKLVSILFRCLRTLGERVPWAEIDYFEEAVLNHRNEAIVLGTRSHNFWLIPRSTLICTRKRIFTPAHRGH